MAFPHVSTSTYNRCLSGENPVCRTMTNYVCRPGIDHPLLVPTDGQRTISQSVSDQLVLFGVRFAILGTVLSIAVPFMLESVFARFRFRYNPFQIALCVSHTCNLKPLSGHYIYIYMYIYTHIHIYIHTYIHTYTQIYIHTYIYTHTYTHTCIYTCIHTYTHTLKYTYIHIHTYIHSCIHTYTQTLSSVRGACLHYFCISLSSVKGTYFMVERAIMV